jgi:hypothetical protein
MFGVREAIVSLGFFGALYCILSLLVVAAWSAWIYFRPGASLPAQWLFALRMFPLAASVLVTLFFAFPAFLLLESNAMDEDSGTLLFSICSLLILGVGLARILSARSQTSRIVEEWMKDASALWGHVTAPAPTLQTRIGVPPLVLVGVSHPRVLVSEEAVSLLSYDELRTAVQHEMAHVRSRDNLKKLILHGTVFPGMASLENAWQEAAELAADEAAVSSRQEAVDLAAALVKMSELVPVWDTPALATNLVNVRALVALRVQRLLSWNGGKLGARFRLTHALLLMLIPVVYVAANYGRALLLTHRFTEWFIH